MNRSFGPRKVAEGGYEFRLWAPAAKTVELVTSQAETMTPYANGWHVAYIPNASAGLRYKFRIDGELEVPDPASAFQPEDVFGPSEIIDQSYSWQTDEWRGRPWHEAVFYELHVGTFTPGGTFRSAIERLDHLKQTGFTAIELMPIADFAGRRNWGYDGVLWYAPDSAYGRPEDLKQLIDAAHARGLMVFLDVVYNHFGPEGNYFPRYAPQFFAREHETPWGAAINYDVPEVRVFAIENALYWLGHFRFDGLRLDAVHAIKKRGHPSILEDLGKAVAGLEQELGRHIHLVLENDDNEAALLNATTVPTGHFRAQWNDDSHHAWHVLLTGETAGYYEDYAKNPLECIARSLTSGFVYQGERSKHRGGLVRGSSSAHLPPTAFVNFLQNHDQIGNRALGDRLESLCDEKRIVAGLSVLLLAPSPPLLFMGEEWGTETPFAFFCDFDGDLGDAVRKGRKREFAAAYEVLGAEAIPDALSKSTSLRSSLNWKELDVPPYADRLALVKQLLETRASWIVPLAQGNEKPFASYTIRGRLLSVHWHYRKGILWLQANLGNEAVSAPPLRGRPIWNGLANNELGAWSVHWTWKGD